MILVITFRLLEYWQSVSLRRDLLPEYSVTGSHGCINNSACSTEARNCEYCYSFMNFILIQQTHMSSYLMDTFSVYQPHLDGLYISCSLICRVIHPNQSTEGHNINTKSEV